MGVHGGFVPICFYQYKQGWIVNPLNDVETETSRFLNAVLGVINGGSFETIDLVGLHLDMHMNDNHWSSIRWSD